MCQVVRARTEGSDVAAVNLHASKQASLARLELERLAGLLPDGQVVVVGDFNARQTGLPGFSAPIGGIDQILVRGIELESGPTAWPEERRRHGRRAPLGSRSGRGHPLARLAPLMNLDAVRAELPVLERKAYLNTGTFGPLPRRTVEALARWERRAVEEGRAGAAFFEEAAELRMELRRRLGDLIGAEEGSLALTSSTTEGCDLVLAGLELGPEDEVVTTDVEHPGLLGALQCSPAGVRVAALRDRPAAEALDAIRAEITPRTRLVAVSQVGLDDRRRAAGAELAGDGVPVLVDGAQAVGTVPVDVGALGCDFYTVSGQKWLLGPDATGALYLGGDWVERLRMKAPSYLSWEDPVGLVPWPDARRFESSWAPPGSVRACSRRSTSPPRRGRSGLRERGRSPRAAGSFSPRA